MTREVYFYNLIESEASNLYFNGKTIKEQIDTKGFYDLEDNNGKGLCHELAVLAMLLLKENPTAALFSGNYHDRYANFVTKHSWVQFSVPGSSEEFVADLAWMHPGFCEAEKYYQRVESNGILLTKQGIPYNDFWKYPFPNSTYNRIQQPETSNIINSLKICAVSLGL